ncbi:CcdB family protein [Sphingomonas turrisvirgatae]|nr:CcdB family protein [Sphingomonas turrisvirgatae]
MVDVQIRARHLGPAIGSLEAERYAIAGAFDLLLTGI